MIEIVSPRAFRTAGLVFAVAGAAQGLFVLFGMRSGSQYSLHDGLMLAGGIALLAAGFSILHEKRAIENVPRSRVRSVAMGFAEMTGVARARTPLVAPISGLSCVFFKYVIEQEESSGRGGTSWRVMERGQSADWFDLDDGTGTIVVDPDGVQAELGRDCCDITRADGLLGRRQRCSEWRVIPGETITVVGTVRALRNLARERQEAVHDRLVALKRDPAKLRAFDADHDGRISTEEWGNAVRVVQDDVLRAAVAAPSGPSRDDLILARGESGETTFVVTDKDPCAIVRSLAIRAGLALAAGLALTAAGAASMFGRSRAGGPGAPW